MADSEGAAPSRTGTPVPEEGKAGGAQVKQGDDKPVSGDAVKENAAPTGGQGSNDLPKDVRSKLQKLDKIEGRYNGIFSHPCTWYGWYLLSSVDLLRSYRIAHSRVAAIDQFEMSLREHTPLTSINDPAALVEYLNQINVRSDMVLNELKRVTSERDSLKKMTEEAEQRAKQAWNRVSKLETKETSLDKRAGPAASEDAATKTTANQPESMSDQSTSKPGAPPSIGSSGQDLPQLQLELQGRQEQVENLELEINSLRGDLSVARESTEGMVQSLETATKELQSLREQREQQDKDFQSERSSLESSLQELNQKLRETEGEFQTLKGQSKTSENTELEEEAERLRAETIELRSTISQHERRVQTLNGLLDNLRVQVKQFDGEKEALKQELEYKAGVASELAAKVQQLELSQPSPQSAQSSTEKAQSSTLSDMGGPTTGAGAGGKKKPRKKRKGGQAGNVDRPEASAQEEKTPTETGDSEERAVSLPDSTLSALQKELDALHRLLEEKDQEIDRLGKKAKVEADLREEIESLRDDLINVGQDHVASKEQIKQLEAERSDLQKRVRDLETEVSDERASSSTANAESDKRLKDLSEEFEELKQTASTLQTDLSAAQQLAASRFKEMTHLKEVLQKAQPEITSLRTEVTTLKKAKQDLDSKIIELKKLEEKEKDLQSDVSSLKKQLSERDGEIQKLSIRVKQEIDARVRAENFLEFTQTDLRAAEDDKKSLAMKKEAQERELAKTLQEVNGYRSRVRDLEREASKLKHDLESLREESDLKAAQHASAQRLMASMRDQTSEMGTQLKEAREQCESLEEELGNAHRLLNERSRESETMRRLLSEVEARADSRIREMREQMDAAIEEKDHAEEEANTVGRTRVREMEDLKAKARDAERDMKRAQKELGELALVQRDSKKKCEDLETEGKRAATEVEELRRALGELRDALDESEKQTRSIEKQKTNLRHELEQSSAQINELQSSHKVSLSRWRQPESTLTYIS